MTERLERLRYEQMKSTVLKNPTDCRLRHTLAFLLADVAPTSCGLPWRYDYRSDLNQRPIARGGETSHETRRSATC